MPLSDRLLTLIRNPETPIFALRDACAEEDPPVATVYVVTGRTLDWINGEEWVETWSVAAYLCPDQADARCASLNQWCVDNECHVEFGFPVEKHPKDCPLDPGFRTDWGGVSYNVVPVPLRVGDGE